MTWVIEQGAVGGVPLLEFQFGCASNAEAIVPSPYQFTYFQGAGFDLSLLSFLQIDRLGCVNVSKLGGVTVGPGGFIDIAQNARKVVFCGTFDAKGTELALGDGRIRIIRHGEVAKLVKEVEQITFSGREALKRSQTGKTWPTNAAAPPARPATGPNRWPAITAAAVAFSMSPSSVSAARSLRPVRRTLVVPMLPEPILRRSPAPASRVTITPNGIEPSR